MWCVDKPVIHSQIFFRCALGVSAWMYLSGPAIMPATAQATDPNNPSVPKPSQPSPLPTLDAPITVPSEPPGQTPSPPANTNPTQKVRVEGFEYVGNRVFEVSELNQATQAFIGKDLSFDDLLQAADAVTQAYVKAGYVTSGAYIPAQDLTQGIVKIQILEGQLTQINLDLQKTRLQKGYIRRRIGLGIDQPLNIESLQESLQLLQQDPLIDKINAELTTGIQPGTNTLNVNVTGAKTLDVRPSLNNNRNISVGTFERGIEISEANLTGRGDKIQAAYRNSDGSDRYEFGYSIPVNARNGNISFFTRFTNNEIQEPSFDDVEIDVDTREFNLSFRQPIVRKANATSSQELALSLTASRLESDSELESVLFGRVGFPLFPGADANGKTRVSALRFGQDWVKRTSNDVISARSQFSLGVDLFGATSNADAPDSNFFAWRGQLQYLRRLGAVSGTPAVSPTLLLRSDLQLTPDPLLSLEQFSAGGQASVRGYRQDALVADNGFQASAEARIPVFRIGKWNSVVQLAPFFDVGTAWNARGVSPPSNVLAGAGLGVIWETGDNFRARFDWGVPLIDIDDEVSGTLQEDGFYFQLEFSPF